MSGSNRATPQPRELEIMRVLFDRNLKDRAIALADSRFPGSGSMVDLAYEWSALDAQDRRQRLSDIGPENIVRFREFAKLNPELSRAVDELDRRGVLPGIEAAALEYNAATEQAAATTAASNATIDAGPTSDNEKNDNGSNAPVSPEMEASTVDTPELVNAPEPTPPVASPEPTNDVPSEQLEEALELRRNIENSDLDTLQVNMPELDLGLPSTAEVMAEESRHREDAVRAAEDAMERVRRTLDASTQRAFERSASIGTSGFPEIQRPTLPSISTAVDSATDGSQPATNAIDAPDRLARHLDRQVVAMVRPGDPVPTIDELVALANDRQLGFTEHKITFGNRKEVFGALVSEFGRIRVRAGSIPKAIAGPNLVVIHGKLAPQIADRIEAGFLDIPGTRASVEVHPDARVVVLEPGNGR